VIFLYGITNTWMERFGARPGDPYTTKQIQHISIAVMFWFAGLVGMGLESRRLRRWLAAISTASLKPSRRNSGAVAEPASYGGSFNPFPALVIGVTGAAMSAHFQTYLFQVSVSRASRPQSVHVPTPRKGSDTCSLGLLPHGIRSFAFPDLSLCLAQPPALYPSLSPSVGSLGRFLSCMRRSDLYHER
jgi:Protein of unknown function (Ytp1)